MIEDKESAHSNLMVPMTSTFSNRKSLELKFFHERPRNLDYIHHAQFKVLEEDEIAQVQVIFNHFDLAGRGRIQTHEVTQILQLMGHNIGKVEEKQLMYDIDKKGKGYFQMQDLINLLCNTGFTDDSQGDLLKSLQELDDDADGYVEKESIVKVLSMQGEGLTREEIQVLLEISCDPNSDRPDLVDINKLAELLIPNVKEENQFEKRVSKITKRIN